MIIFHEGLPRSGKSYEACVSRIIPALKAGRQVFAYIEGLNHAKFAEMTGKTIEEVQGKKIIHSYTEEEVSNLSDEISALVKWSGSAFERIEYRGLLFQIEAEQVRAIHDHVANDSMVIIDELQDFFPAGQKKLDDDITKFVTQHGHRGIDIICMGQDHRDCHNLWKRRIDQLYAFTKQDAIGRPNSYTWVSYKQKAGKLVKLNSGTGKYDKQFFGLYLSHTVDTANKETYNDDRANVFKTWGFRWGLPVALCAGIFSVYYLWGIFHGEKSVVKTERLAKKVEMPKTQTGQGSKNALAANNQTVPAAQQPKQHTAADYDYKTYIDTVVSRYRPRLAALIWGKNKIVAKIDFMDDTLHVKESFNLDQLAALGWQYSKTEYGILLKKQAQNIVVTAWPLEQVARVSNETASQL